MAEGNSTDDSNSWESWLGGWMQTAKEKSATAFEMVKKDLAEFTCTMHKDTEKAVEITRDSINKENTTHATDRMKAGLSSLLGNISKALVIPPDDDYVPMKVAPDGSGLYDRGKARLHAIQLDASTYIDPPKGTHEQFNMWLESFNLDEHKGEISELLVSKVEVRALYTKLVPGDVSHAEFWQRYFYRVHQLQCDEARKQALMKRADQTKGDSFSWDDDDDDWSGGEEDDGNHSDWEKMPRPPQSLVARPNEMPAPQASPKASSSPKPKVVSEKEQQNADKSFTASNQGKSAEPVKESKNSVSDDRMERVGSPPKAVLETSMSAFAAGMDQPEGQMQELGSEKSSNFVVESEDVQDACGESSSVSVGKPPSDLWSLHIPSDTASASHQGENDYDSIKTASVEAGSPSDAYRQRAENDKTQSGPSSCAAAGGDPSPSGVTTLVVSSPDGACGASDLGLAPARPSTQPVMQPVANPSPDISAACIDVGSAPALVPLSDQGALLQDSSSNIGSAQATAKPLLQADRVNVQPEPSQIQNENKLTSSEEKSTVSAFEAPKQADTVAKDDSSPHPSPVQKMDIPAAGAAKSPAALAKPESEPAKLVEPAKFAEPAKSAESAKSSEEDKTKDIGMRIKGDMVVVGDRGSPASSDSSDHKEIDDEWEQDFDIEVTEEDLKAAEDIAKRLGENLTGDNDDWENWE